MAWDFGWTAGRMRRAALIGAVTSLCACADMPVQPGTASRTPTPIPIAGTLPAVGSLPALVADARKQMALNAPRRALGYLDTAVRLSADDQGADRAEVLSLRAEALLATGQAGRALADVDMAIAMRDDIAPYHALRAAALFGLKRLPDALGALDRAIALMPDQAPYYLLRAVVQLVVGNTDAALADFGAFGARQGGLHNAFQRAVVQHLERNFPAAIAEYDRVLAQDDSGGDMPARHTAVTRLMRGFAHHQAGHFEAATRDYGAALALRPDWGFLRDQRERARSRIPLGPAVEA